MFIKQVWFFVPQSSPSVLEKDCTIKCVWFLISSCFSADSTFMGTCLLKIKTEWKKKGDIRVISSLKLGVFLKGTKKSDPNKEMLQFKNKIIKYIVVSYSCGSFNWRINKS